MKFQSDSLVQCFESFTQTSWLLSTADFILSLKPHNRMIDTWGLPNWGVTFWESDGMKLKLIEPNLQHLHDAL